MAARRPGGRRRTWTTAMREWLARHRAEAPLREIAARFRFRFGLRADAWPDYIINAYCRNHRIRAAYSGRFPAGHRPWNTGRTGLPSSSPRTVWRPGNVPQTTVPVGTYLRDSTGRWKMKVNDSAPAGMARRNWRRVSHLTWEAHHGPLPAGWVVMVLDGDEDAVLERDRDNLLAVPRGVVSIAVRTGYAALPPDRALRRLALLEAWARWTALRAAEGRLGMTGWLERQRAIGGVVRAYAPAAGAAGPAEAGAPRGGTTRGAACCG